MVINHLYAINDSTSRVYTCIMRNNKILHYEYCKSDRTPRFPSIIRVERDVLRIVDGY